MFGWKLLDYLSIKALGVFGIGHGKVQKRPWQYRLGRIHQSQKKGSTFPALNRNPLHLPIFSLQTAYPKQLLSLTNDHKSSLDKQSQSPLKPILISIA